VALLISFPVVLSTSNGAISSVNNATSPVQVSIKRCQAIYMEVEGEPFAAGHP